MRGFKALVLCAILTALLCACDGVDPPASPSGEGDSLLSIAGTELERGEIAYLLGYVVGEYSLFRDIDWDGRIESVPARRYFLDRALEQAVNAHVTAAKAAELGYELTEEEESGIDWAVTWEIDEWGGWDAFLEAMGAAGLTEETYRFYAYTVPALRDKLISGLFGPGGPYAPGEDALWTYYSGNYVTVSYIFLLATDEYGEMLTGDQWETQRSVAEALRRKAVSGEDFFGMVELYGQDYLMSLSPWGMPVPFGMIGTAFDTAMSALKEGEISEVVATDEGFYIILRLPEDREWFEQNREEIWYSCAFEAFSEKIDEWGRGMTVEVSGAFYELDPMEMVAVG
ncbi:MAG: peptidyl-prolyl cis-trans isomerase [Oscillospiraceae bacterium]|jgi:hypothetical protein|nr:peptidyl-prolyl cis-trans isomerase [Oscillospiraceae bacterium]